MAYNENPDNVDTSSDEDEPAGDEEGSDYTPPDVPDGLEEALPDMIGRAINYVSQAFEQEQAEMTDFYKGELPGITEQDLEDGRSDLVSRDVHDAVMAAMPDLVRIFLGPEHVIHFEPSGPQTDEMAAHATETIRWVFEKENDAFAIIHGALKDGLVRMFAVAMWWHELVDKSYTAEYTIDEDTLAQMLEDEHTSVVTSKTLDDMPDPETGRPMVSVTLRHERTEHCFRVELVPPEELIISDKARDTSGRWLVGRRRNLPREELIGLGLPEELIDAHLTADSTIETSSQAQERKPDDMGATPGTSDGADTEQVKEALYIEQYLTWPYEDRMQLFKVCTLGTAHEIVACDPVDNVDMALWTPDPEPHTPISEAWAHKVKDIQRAKTGVWRGIMDSLAEALVPRMEVVEGQTNIEDAMSTEIGGLIRVRQPNMVRPVSQPFLGQNAVPLIESIDNMREERVGAFRAADGLSAESMQSSTKMAVAATISGSKAQKELLARIFANNFLRPVFRGLLRLFVQHQDKPKTIRINGDWTQIDPRGWNVDMDCSVDVGVATMTNDERLQILGGIAEKQEQILQMLGPVNPLVNLGHYAYTLRKMAQLSGYRSTDGFFGKVPTDPQQLAQLLQQMQQLMPQKPDPTAMLAQAQVQSLEKESARKDAESAHKASIASSEQDRDEDFRRDQLAQDRELKLLELAGHYGVSIYEVDARIQAEQKAARDAAGNAQVTQTAQLISDHVGQSQAQQHEATQNEQQRLHDAAVASAGLDQQSQDGEQQRMADMAQHAVTLDHQTQEGEANRSLQDKQHQRDTKASAAQADADRKAAAAQPKGPTK